MCRCRTNHSVLFARLIANSKCLLASCCCWCCLRQKHICAKRCCKGRSFTMSTFLIESLTRHSSVAWHFSTCLLFVVVVQVSQNRIRCFSWTLYLIGTGRPTLPSVGPLIVVEVTQNENSFYEVSTGTGTLKADPFTKHNVNKFH